MTEATEQRSYIVKTPQFEGPLDLLLDLIEKKKLVINEIALSKVADDYIEYIKTLAQFPIAMSAHFILVASTLLLIKSKSLLPNLVLSEEERGNIAELERRLRLLKRGRELSRHIQKNFGVHIIYPAEQRIMHPVFSPDKDMSVSNLLASLHRLLQNLPEKQSLPKAVVQKVISLEEMISNLTERIKKSLRLSFKEFAHVGKKEKVHVIVSFLAMLELVKQGIISVQQSKHFDEIIMETERLEVPRYT